MGLDWRVDSIAENEGLATVHDLETISKPAILSKSPIVDRVSRGFQRRREGRVGRAASFEIVS